MLNDIPLASHQAVNPQFALSRLLVALLTGSVAGVAIQLQQAALAAASHYAVLTAIALMGLTGVMCRGQRSTPRVPRLVWLCTVLLAAAAGFGLTGLRATAFEKTALNPALEGKDIQVIGLVAALPQIGEDGLRFRFAVESARLNGQAVSLPPAVYLSWYSGFWTAGAVKRPKASPQPSSGRAAEAEGGDVADFLPETQRPPMARAGERWQFTVRLKAPHGNSNPHGYDYELSLWEQGVQATGYVRAGPNDPAPKNLLDTGAHPVERARQAVRTTIFERVTQRQLAGLLAALVVGDQNAIERADWDVFRATGVAHLMSISGLHITMFAWAASLALGWLWRRSVSLTPGLCLALPAGTAGAWGGLLLAVLYALFSGWGLPAQRTIWMLATVVLLRQSGRHWPWPLVWLLAMAIVVALDPWALLQAGFWLSFVAVGILFAAGPSEGETASSGRDALQTVRPHGFNDAIYSGATDPYNSFATDQKHTEKAVKSWPWAARLTPALAGAVRAAREQWVITLALTPLTLLLFHQVSLVGLLANAIAIPWVTLLVTPLAMLGVLWSPFWDLAAGLAGWLKVFLQFLASWPLASISVAAAPVWCGLAGVAGGVLLALKLPWHWRLLGLPLLLPVLLWQPIRPAPGEFELLGADIGQGNAVVVRTAGHSLVYDTGPRFSRESDAGHRVLVPLLRAFGERLDLLVLSHRDLDHVGGAAAVLAMQPQAGFLSSIEKSHALQAVRAATPCVAGQHWRWDGVDFDVLHPDAADYETVTKSNAMSCVLRISSGTQTALLVGDIEAPQELRLIGDARLASLLKADFLLIPHHGSKTSSTAAFLDVVQPRVALAQTGYRNRFGHPAESVLSRYRERGISIYQSPWCGAASWRSQRPGEVVCQRKQALRYWHHRPAGMP